MASAYSNPVERKPDAVAARREQKSPRLAIVGKQVVTGNPSSISREEAVRQAILRTG